MRVLACVTVAAAAAALLVTGCGDSPEDTAGTAPPAPSVSDAPAIKGWSRVHGVLVPLGTTDGPTSGAGEPFTGYTHTPQGAALAAIDESVQLSTAPDNSWSRVLSVVAASGPGRDQFAVNRALVSASDSIDPAVAPSIVGYVFTDYTDARATLDIVQRFPDASLAAARTTVVWVGTDWKLDLPTSSSTSPVTALTEIPSAMVDLEATR